ncbi:MAG: hypothetical protein GXO70_00845 [Acidobacteria bacterium]|nr:hypothetical protein [Acidobacteriota bacterium]
MKIKLLLFLLVISQSLLFGQNQIRKCIICHQKPDIHKVMPTGIERSVYVDKKVLRSSVHHNLKCQDCHADVTSIPHQGLKIGRVNCSRCHFNGNNMGAPNSPMYDQFWESVHGKKLREGAAGAPQCQTCHGGHNVFKASNPRSTVYKKNLPSTCGQCHEKELHDYSGSIHGVAILQKGILNVPVCTDCHGKHDVYSSNMSGSHTSKQNVPDTCKSCHDDYKLMSKFKLTTDQADTFTRSFHGIALRFGEKTVANCASCHGTHNIRKQDDPASSIYPANIPKTCGQCHKGANENFANGKVHLNPENRDSGLVYYISNFFFWLTTLTMLALFTHILLDLRRKLKEKKEEKETHK